MSEVTSVPLIGPASLLKATDPRVHSSSDALVLASRNAYPVVASSKRRGDSTGLLVGAAAATLLGGVTFYSLANHRAPAFKAKPILAHSAPVTVPTPIVPVAPSPPFPAGLVGSGVKPVPQVVVPVAPAAGVDEAHSTALVFDGSTPLDGAMATGSAQKAAAKPDAGSNENDQFAFRIGGEGGDAATAEQMSDPALTVAQGTIIPAVLETAIDTDLPGYVRASVSRDVRSFDGSQVLVPRFSRLIGQYKSGLQAGQTRVYIVWQRLIRSDGLTIAIASPAIDFSGRTGLGGKVDGHFLKRFGSAALLSVVGGLSAIGNASVVLSGGQSAATVAAQRDTQIPPTIRVAQGQPIRIFTARDLDFTPPRKSGQE